MSINTDAYEIDDPEAYEELGRRMDKRGMDNSGGIYNGSTRIITWMMALLNGLTIAGIVGGVMMYGRVSVLEEKITNLSNKVEMIIKGDIKVPHGP
jgi:hypothetical protein